MSTIKWEAPGSIQTILGSGLNSLADGANETSPSISNDQAAELNLYMMLELYLAAPSTRASDARVDLYLLPTVDGTNYAMGSDSIDPSPANWVGQFIPPADTTAVYLVIQKIEIPPVDFKLLLINETGVAFASSGNTLKYKIYSIESS